MNRLLGFNADRFFSSFARQRALDSPNGASVTRSLCERAFALACISQRAVQDAAARKILVHAGRGKYRLVDSVRGYCEHLRKLAQGMGGEAALEEAARQRAKLAKAQAQLAEAKAKHLAGELVEANEVEALWTRKLSAFRNRILAIPGRVRDLSARQNGSLTQELRAALTERDEAHRRTPRMAVVRVGSNGIANDLRHPLLFAFVTPALDGSAADDPGVAELRSMAAPEVSPPVPVEDLLERSVSAGEPGGAELCSFAPPEVSPAVSPAGLAGRLHGVRR